MVAAADRPYFVLGVTGDAAFDDAVRVRAVLSRLTARVAATHAVVLHTGCGTRADRHAREAAELLRWSGGVTECSPPGFRPSEVCRRAVCGLAVCSDAVVLFTVDPDGPEARFARWVCRQVRAPLRVVGPRGTGNARGRARA